MDVELTSQGSSPEVASPTTAMLSASQAEVVNSGMLDGSAILHVATSWGKTWIARLAIRRVLERGLKAVYLCPLRAIAKELQGAWSAEFDGWTLGAYTGDHGQDELAKAPPPADADILIATPEKLDYFVRSWRTHLGWLAQVDLLVVDELHTLGSRGRGATLEGVIARLRALSPFVRVLGLSATLGNAPELGDWLGAQVYESTQRPVPLSWRIAPFKNQSDKAAIAIEECHRVTRAGGQVIVFVQSRPRAESLAASLASEGLRAKPHHAGLARSKRNGAEEEFRSRLLDVLVATPTLAQGVNLPARTVIVYDLSRWEAGGWVGLSTNEVWQLAGRAGRRGLDESGEAILLAPKWDQTAARQHVRGKFEAILSQIGSERRAEAEQIMVIYGSGLARTERQAERVAGQLLMGHGMSQLDRLSRVTRASKEMIEAGMLARREDGSIAATRLGRIAVRYQLSPETVAAWSRAIHAMTRVHLFDILLCVCASVDFTARVRCEADTLDACQRALSAEPSTFKRLERAELREYTSVRGRDMVRSVKTALSLRAWTRLGDIDEAAAAVGVMPHELEEARTECVRMLHALSALSSEMGEGLPPPGGESPRLDDQLLAVRSMVCAGLDDEQATLALIDGVGPVLARRLIDAGIDDVEDLAVSDAAALAAAVRGLSAARAQQWIAQAAEHLGSGGAFRFREWEADHADIADTPRASREARLDYFRWQRASLLTVLSGVPDTWTVSGGSEPHEVLRVDGEVRCACKDAGKGHLCKHAIAVRAVLGDPAIPPFSPAAFEAPDEVEDSGGSLNLIQEWGVPTCR